MKLHLPVVSVYTVPTDAPEADGTLAWNSTTVVIAEVTAVDATGTGWTYGPAAVGDFLRDHLAPLVEGRNALDIPAAHDAMTRAIRNAGRRASPRARSRRWTSPCGTSRPDSSNCPWPGCWASAANASPSTAAAASRRTTTHIWPRS